MMSSKVIVIGLDGATFDILTPMLERRKLPHLCRMIEEGCHGTLTSTIPPYTGPAWVSFATGKHPGKTGVFDFFNLRDGGLSFEPVSSRHYAHVSYWDLIGQSGIRVGIANYPMLYPPYPVDGFMISGLGSSASEGITYPESLKEELTGVTGSYMISLASNQPKYMGKESLFLRDINAFLDKRMKAFDYLLHRYPVDCFTAIFSETDVLQHYLWKHVDPSHPLYSPKDSPRYAQAFEEIWMKIDAWIGGLLETFSGGADILVVSDHGFGPWTDTFYCNRWLEKEGYLVLKKRGNSPSRYFRRLAERHLFRSPWAGKLMNLARKASRGFRPSLMEGIDFSKTIAFASETLGGIYLNRWDRNPHAPIRTPQEGNAIREELMRRLREASPHPIRCYTPQEIYEGPKISLAPDVLFSIDDYRCDICNTRFPDGIFKKEAPSPNISGTHRREGIFIAWGNHIRTGVKLNAEIVDIAPTILYLYGLPIPTDLDGSVLVEGLDEAFTRDHSVSYVSPPPSSPEGEPVGREDISDLRERLRGLGYLE